MIGNFLRVSTEELNEYISDSSKLEDRIYDEDAYNDKNLIDVDKSWEAIFFILTGKSIATGEEADTPLCWTLSGPQEIDPDQDLGYGPATYTSVQQTKEINQELNKLSLEELKARYNSKLMMELGIYPEAWEHEESLSYLMENIVSLKEFYNNAARDNQAVILFVN